MVYHGNACAGYPFLYIYRIYGAAGRVVGMIDASDLLCPRHLREAAEQDVSGIELALAVARCFNRMPEYRQDDPGEAAFWARYCCERISPEDLDRAWRKAYRPPSPAGREQRRAVVPRQPIYVEVD